MTAYAMPAHLTVNLCWLWLVLRRRWWADIVALTLGLFAVGLHQIHYHPLFAAPILFLLLLRKEWGRAAFYALGYLAIGLFWRSAERRVGKECVSPLRSRWSPET